MKITFPDSFIFGTSTSAYQIETPFEHDWLNVKARDGNVFQKTTDHEKRHDEDCDIIASLAPHYRMSLMWSKLQREPLAPLHEQTKMEYHSLLEQLRHRDVSIMMVLHHFANPLWFAKRGGWERQENISLWVDFAEKVVDEFGHHVLLWNTFNEPNLYVTMGWMAKEFPPYKRNIFTAKKVIENIAAAHERMYEYIKQKYPHAMVGISHNCTVFAAGNFLGYVPAKFADFCYMRYAPELFTKTDFFGMSYYARITYDPFPITYLTTPKKIERLKWEHDDMWEYYPEGLKACIHRYWKEYGKPIIVAENGICTNDDTKRIRAIRDYLKVMHDAMQEGAQVIGYYHWSTWDNFEWSLGPTYRFGLFSCDPITKERRKKPSADVYSRIAYSKALEI